MVAKTSLPSPICYRGGRNRAPRQGKMYKSVLHCTRVFGLVAKFVVGSRCQIWHHNIGDPFLGLSTLLHTDEHEEHRGPVEELFWYIGIWNVGSAHFFPRGGVTKVTHVSVPSAKLKEHHLTTYYL